MARFTWIFPFIVWHGLTLSFNLWRAETDEVSIRQRFRATRAWAAANTLAIANTLAMR